MVGQNTDGAPAEHAQEAKDHFALLVVAVGETFVITVAVHGMTRVNGTGRTIAAEAGLSNLHNAGGTITTWPARQAQRPEAQRLRRKSRASGQAGTRSTNQAPRNNVIRTMTRYHGGARHVTGLLQLGRTTVFFYRRNSLEKSGLSIWGPRYSPGFAFDSYAAW